MPIDQLTAGEEGILSSHSLHTEPLSLDNLSSTRFGVTNKSTKKLFKSIRLSEKKQHLPAKKALLLTWTHTNHLLYYQKLKAHIAG